MNISTLEHYVERKNAWAELFNGKALSLLDAADRATIAKSLDADLSPENLTCDGELRGQALRNRQAYLTRCVDELLSIDPSCNYFLPNY
jgi:hypothetical protein